MARVEGFTKERLLRDFREKYSKNVLTTFFKKSTIRTHWHSSMSKVLLLHNEHRVPTVERGTEILGTTMGDHRLDSRDQRSRGAGGNEFDRHFGFFSGIHYMGIRVRTGPVDRKVL